MQVIEKKIEDSGPAPGVRILVFENLKAKKLKTRELRKPLICLYLGSLVGVAIFCPYFGILIASGILLLSFLALYYYLELKLPVRTIGFHILVYVLIIFVLAYLFGIRG